MTQLADARERLRPHTAVEWELRARIAAAHLEGNGVLTSEVDREALDRYPEPRGMLEPFTDDEWAEHDRTLAELDKVTRARLQAKADKAKARKAALAAKR